MVRMVMDLWGFEQGDESYNAYSLLVEVVIGMEMCKEGYLSYHYNKDDLYMVRIVMDLWGFADGDESYNADSLQVEVVIDMEICTEWVFVLQQGYLYMVRIVIEHV